MPQVTFPFKNTPLRRATLGLMTASAIGLGGCSSMEGLMGGDKIDYRSGAAKTSPLEVPPDLTPLVRDTRYLPQAGSVSATALQQQGASRANNSQSVALTQAGDLRIERSGSQRWLVSSRTPEQLWPLVRQFWIDRGFTMATESAEAGVMETDWAENRAKLPTDLIRNTLGKVLDSLYSTGERDKFRTRLERVPGGTEIYISHRGLEEVYIGKDRDGGTGWAGRGPDAALESEFLARMMISLGAPADTARAAVAGTAPTTEPKARVLAGQPAATLQVDDAFERAWRRVGLALDRGGFTVEDRDRVQGIYFVRFVDAKEAAKDGPGFFSRLFGASEDASKLLNRYRIVAKAEGNGTLVTVQNSQGQPDSSANAQKIVTLLAEELKR